jgi:PAS domain S-box-containing protein
MEINSLRIVAIDDSEESLLALKVFIAKQLPDAKYFTACNGLEGLALVRQEDPDVVLVDIVMPVMDGYAVCQEIKADPLLQMIPVIIMTGFRTDRDSRLKALEMGAEGFIMKPFDEIEVITQIKAFAKIKQAKQNQFREKTQLEQLVAEKTRKLETELAERKAVEETLKKSETLNRIIITYSPIPIYSLDRDGKVMSWNKAAEKVFGWKEEEVLGKRPPFVQEDKLEEYNSLRNSIMEGMIVSGKELVRRRKDGTPIVISLSAASIHDADAKVIGIMAAAIDITQQKTHEAERDKLQEQLLQAQKMESVGRLAGGVAHDFNNMLSVILGYAEMALNQIPANGPLHFELSEIYKAAERSASLTQQLLAFARKQTINPKVLNPNETVESILKMLKRLIGENIELKWLPGSEIWSLLVDPNQVGQILANLCVNSRDAINGVGNISIETQNVIFDETYCSCHADAIPGQYVLLAVSDDGCGMDKETQGKLFEPFFTTKEIGEGTGLGLAMVYGIVKQNNGFINVYSEPGRGTSFKIYLPRYQGEAEETKQVQCTEILPGKGETLLIVEDEEAILQMSKRMLEQLGYKVLAANTPEKAIRLVKEHGPGIQLLITDLIMPEMDGKELSKQIRNLYPEIKTLYMSGYTSNMIAHKGVLDEGIHFLSKPFTVKDLANRLREALEK